MKKLILTTALIIKKKSTITLACFLLGLISFSTSAQVISVAPGTDLTIGSGTLVSADSLDITPSANFILNGSSMTKSNTVINSSSIPYIKKVYQFSNTSNAFSGALKMFYNNADLNGITESGLQLLIHNGSSWSLDINSTVNTTNKFVQNNSVSGVSLREISAGACTPNTGDTTASACVSFVWYGVTYNASATPTRTFTNVSGCDSVVTLHLTINPIPATPTVNVVNNCDGTSTLSTTASGTLLWSTGATTSSIIVSTAGTYTVTQTVDGCVSEAGSGDAAPETSNTSTTTETACDSYTWPVNGQTYSSSGTYTSVSGCATRILNLTITPSTSNTTTVNACGSYIWSVDGQTYTSSGSYTSVSGCATEILNLTINPNLPASVSITSTATGNRICTATSVTFTATPTNGGAYPIYQWKLNGNNVGTNSSTYTNNNLANADVVSVVMTSNDVSTVAIGTQFWTNKNLDVSKYKNGVVIPQVTNATAWAALTTGAWCWYNNDSATYAATYGKLYNWYAVNDIANGGLAPTGWYVATDAEWTTLTTTLGTNPGSQLKSTTGWGNGNGTNSSGFTALSGGQRANTGAFNSLGADGYWWSNTQNNSTTAFGRVMSFDNRGVDRLSFNKKNAFSVRCVKDAINATSACYVNSPATNSITMAVGQSNTGDTTASACVSFVWYGVTYNASATPTRTFTNASGCDSVVTLNLTINPIPATPTVNVVNNCNGTSTLSTTATGTLLWSTGATTSSIIVSIAGTYTVTQTVNGCTSEAGSGTASPKATPATPTVNVVNNCNGTSTLSTTATGTLLWNTGATTSSIIVNSAGTYTVTQTVDSCTSEAGSGTAAPKTAPATPTVNVVNNCNGTSTLSTTASGTLLWSTGATTSSIIVSSAGTYTVTQTVDGCVSEAGSGTAAPKTAPATPIVNVINNCNGTSTLSTTATGTLLWSTGATTSSIIVSSAGAYTVTQTVDGCTSEAGSGTAAPKTTPSTPTVTVVNNCNGTSTLSTGASGTLLWSTGATTSSIIVSSAGTYTVTQTVDGCSSEAGSGTAAPKTAPTTPTVNVVNNCNGTSTLSTTASGTLLWSTGATTASIIVNSAGTYTVTQTVDGCTSDAGSGTAAPKTAPATPIVNVINNCNGTSTLSTTASGTLLWSTGATTASIIVNIAGTYTVTQTVDGCTSEAGSGTAAPKTAPATPTVNVVNNCNGTSTLSTTATGTLLWSTGASTASIIVNSAGTYTVTQTVDGCASEAGSGTAAPKTAPATPIVNVVNNSNGIFTLSTAASGTLLWSNGATASSIIVSSAGTYTVTQTVDGCASEAGSGTVALSTNADPAVGQMYFTTTAGVDQDANNLLLAPSTAVYDINVPFYNLNQNNAIPNQTIEFRVNLGRKLILNPGFNLATAPLSTYFDWTETSVGGDIILVGTQKLAIPADFNDIATFRVKADSACRSNVVSNIVITNVGQQLNDDDNQNNTASLQYNLPITLTRTFVNITCNGANNGSISVVASSGTRVIVSSPNGYRDTTYLPSGSNNFTKTGLAPGVYSITASATSASPLANCSVSTTATITEPSLLVLPAGNISNTNIVCFGASDATISVLASGGNSPYTYVIAGPTVNTSGALSGTFTGLSAGSYTITVTDNNGCTATTGAIVVTAPSGITDISLGSDVTATAFNAPGATQTIVYNIAEVAASASVGDTIRITKVNGFTINFSATQTSATVGSTTYNVDNSNWKIDNSNPAFVSIILTDPGNSNGPGTIFCSQLVRVAISITRNTSDISVFTLSARLRKADGEVNLNNNLNSIIFSGE